MSKVKLIEFLQELECESTFCSEGESMLTEYTKAIASLSSIQTLLRVKLEELDKQN